MTDRVHDLLAEYEHLRLECDGFTQVATYVLTRAGIPHRTMGGSVRMGDRSFEPHFWIDLQDGRVADYKTRMWLGPEAPQGVFRPGDHGVVYDGTPQEMHVPEWMFVVLTMPD